MAKLNLKYDRLSYQANRADIGIKNVKAEYTRFKRIAKDRMSRMGDFGGTESYRRAQDIFSEGVRGKSEAQLRKMLYEAYAWVSNPYHTASAMKEHRSSVMESVNQLAGENILNKENMDSFYAFMNDKQAQAVLAGLDSGQKLELFRMRSKGLSMNSILKDFSKLLDNADEVNEYLDEHSDRKRAASSYDLRKILS